MQHSNPRRTFMLPVALTAIWLVLTANGQYWRLITEISQTWDQSAPLFLVSIALVNFLFVNLILTLLTFGRATRFILCVFLVVSSFTAYFMSHYGILIDQDMVRNALETDRFEAAELINWGLIRHVALFGVVPAVLIWRLGPAKQSLLRGGVVKLTITVISVVMIGATVAPFYKDFASLIRNHREIKYLLVPINFIFSSYKVVASEVEIPIEPVAIGIDAHKGLRWNRTGRKTLAVIVVGETARAANFSLGGYERDTNPRLAETDAIYFQNVSSCGTATSISLPCMFSDLAQSNYSKTAARQREGLLDVISHSGLKTLWIDNNSGCKGVCKQSRVESVAHINNAELCNDDGCYDGVLLEKLRSVIGSVHEDTVVILHKNGSHGPSYYRRYPKTFQAFQPECQSDDFANCTRQQIVNSYDNTILYTDYILAEIIAMLDQHADTLNTVLFYVSDHGESLGEHGLYLHGAPNFIAPDVQTHVPLVIWMSSTYQKQFAIERSCIEAQSDDKISHDFMFHSVLGMLDIETTVRRQELDIFSGCHRGSVSASNHSIQAPQ